MKASPTECENPERRSAPRDVLTFERSGPGRRTGASQVWVNEYVVDSPIRREFVSTEQAHLDLTFRRPRPCKVSFYERWGPERFEPVGRALFVPPGLKLIGTCPTGQVVQLTCLLDASLFDGLLTDDLSERALEHCLDVREPNVLRSLHQVYLEMLRPGLGARLMVEARLITVCVELARHLQKFPADRRGGLPSWRVRLIEERLRAEGPPPTVAELAQLCNMSTRHLARAFSHENGHSISEHVRAACLARAQQMLAEGDLSLTEIAGQLGFSSRRTFSVAYRRQTGSSPLKDRARRVSRRRAT